MATVTLSPLPYLHVTHLVLGTSGTPSSAEGAAGGAGEVTLVVVTVVVPEAVVVVTVVVTVVGMFVPRTPARLTSSCEKVTEANRAPDDSSG
jgi:hypothetical protein